MTDVAPQVALILQRAHSALLVNPRKELGLGRRHEVWAALGPPGVGDVGHLRRSWLAIATAKYALGVWESAWPADDRPHQVLELAERVLGGLASPEAASRVYGLFWDQLLTVPEDDEIPCLAGFAALQALRTAIEDEHFDPSAIDTRRVDEDLDFAELDAGFFTAASLAGGAVGAPMCDDEKRKSVWLWWLHEAVPQAWSAFAAYDAGAPGDDEFSSER